MNTTKRHNPAPDGDWDGFCKLEALMLAHGCTVVQSSALRLSLQKTPKILGISGYISKQALKKGLFLIYNLFVLKRYIKDDDTKLLYLVYTKDEHQIDNSKIDKRVIYIIKTLIKAGYEAYIVGGAVRDLILGIRPKDFDIATSATPKEVKKLFKNSRIIGKRFQIVHIFFDDVIYEISTFRSSDAVDGKNNNVFGTLQEDADRRDFTVNSLYYDPVKSYLYDFHGGFNDLKKKRLRAVIPMSVSFKNDPVRMIRAIKFATKCSLTIDSDIKAAFFKYASELTTVSDSRIVEEFNKIMLSGFSFGILERLEKYDLLIYITPRISEEITRHNKTLSHALSILDRKVRKKPDVTLQEAYAALMAFIIDKAEVEEKELSERVQYGFSLLYKGLRPLNVGKNLLFESTKLIYKAKNIDYLLAKEEKLQKRRKTPTV